MDDDISIEWTPDFLSLDIGEQNDGLRYVKQQLEWSTSTGALRSGDYFYKHSILLNDSDESQYGPSVYLDAPVSLIGRVPDISFDTTLPDATVLGRIGDETFEKRYGFGISQANLIETNRRYEITFITDPGDVEVDNARVELSLAYKLTDGCSSRICSIEQAWCYYTKVLWGDGVWHVDPIPGSSELNGHPTKCLHRSFIFLPSVWE